MPTKLTRVEEVLRSEMPGASDVTDAAVTTTCPTCTTRQPLSRAAVDHEGTDTVYVCMNGCRPIVIISDPEPRELPGRGHRLGSVMVRNVSDLEVAIGAAPVTIPASPKALEALSGRTLKHRV